MIKLNYYFQEKSTKYNGRFPELNTYNYEKIKLICNRKNFFIFPNWF